MAPKNKRGRPTAYRPEYAQQLLDYFSRPAWDSVDANGNVVEGFFPTLAGFCWEIKIAQATLTNWVNAQDMDGSPLFPDIFDAYRAVKDRQEQVFTAGYMRGKYFNPAIGALIAKNLMNWRDKQDIESNITQTVDATVTVGDSLADTLARAKAKVQQG